MFYAARSKSTKGFGILVLTWAFLPYLIAGPDGNEDCNANGVADSLDVETGFSRDCNRNDVPDECEQDCNGNDVPDECDVAPPLEFPVPQRFATGGRPQALVAMDLDGDGVVDLVVSAQEGDFSDTLSVLLGRRDGTFFRAQQIAVSGGAISPIAVDLDGDGVLDLATANDGLDGVSVFLGLGDGKFGEQRRLRTGSRPVSVVAADLNGDGVLDLATANAGSADPVPGAAVHRLGGVSAARGPRGC